MTTPKLFEFAVTNQRTGETISFLGQGLAVEEAFKDGVKNCQDTFKHKNDGKQRDPNSCAVTLKNGQRVLRMFKEWESDLPFAAKIVPVEFEEA